MQEPEATECAGCRLVPISVLSLDHPEPLVGWERTLLARGIEVLRDDLGRACVARPAARQLMTEHVEWERHESLVAAGGVVTPAQEFGGGRTPVFQDLLDEWLAEGRKRRDK